MVAARFTVSDLVWVAMQNNPTRYAQWDTNGDGAVNQAEIRRALAASAVLQNGQQIDAPFRSEIAEIEASIEELQEMPRNSTEANAAAVLTFLGGGGIALAGVAMAAMATGVGVVVALILALLIAALTVFGTVKLLEEDAASRSQPVINNAERVARRLADELAQSQPLPRTDLSPAPQATSPLTALAPAETGGVSIRR